VRGLLRGAGAPLWSLVELPVTKWHRLTFVDGSGRAWVAGGRTGRARRAGCSDEPERLVIRGPHDQDVPRRCEPGRPDRRRSDARATAPGGLS